MLLIFLLLLSFFYLNPFIYFLKLFKIFELYLLFIYIKKNITTQQYKNLIILLCIGIHFESFLSILQFVNQSSLNGIFYFFGERTFASATPGIAQAIIDGKLILRPYGTFSHPNSLAGYFLAALFLILSLRGAKRRSNLLNKFVILNSCFVILVLFLTLSRSAWFVAFLIFFSIGLLNIKKLINILLTQNKFLVFGLIFGFCFLIFGLLPAVEKRIISIKTTDAQSLEKRLNLNSVAWKMFLSSPIIGVGLNNFIPNLPRFTANQPQVRFYQPVHNIYLLILAESGLLGFSIFLYVIYKIIKFSYSHIIVSSSLHIINYPYLYIFISFISILMLGLFDHYSLTLQQNQLLLTLVLGLIFSQNNFFKKNI